MPLFTKNGVRKPFAGLMWRIKSDYSDSLCPRLKGSDRFFSEALRPRRGFFNAPVRPEFRELCAAREGAGIKLHVPAVKIEEDGRRGREDTGKKAFA